MSDSNNKGVLKHRTDIDSLLDRELGIANGTVYFVQNGVPIPLARQDLSNVTSSELEALIADRLSSITTAVSAVQAQANTNTADIPTKKDRVIGLTGTLPDPLMTVDGNNVTLAACQYFSGTGIFNFDGAVAELYEEPDEADEDLADGDDSGYSSQAVYLGISKLGGLVVSTEKANIDILFGSVFINADGNIGDNELVISPYLAESNTYNRELPIVVESHEVAAFDNSGTKALSVGDYYIVSEGINYTYENSPNRKDFSAESPLSFKYYYPDWSENGNAETTELGAFFYNTTTKALEQISSTWPKYAIYRVVLIETGQHLLLCQQAASVDDLYESIEEIEVKLDSVSWNTEELSSRAIYLNEFVAISADLSIVETVKKASSSNTINTYYNSLLYGILDEVTELPVNRAAFVTMFSQEPNQYGSVYKKTTNGWQLCIINMVEADGALDWTTASTYTSSYIDTLIANIPVTPIASDDTFETGTSTTEVPNVAQVKTAIDNVTIDTSGLASVDMDNISGAGKETVVGWGMPDYDNGVTIFEGDILTPISADYTPNENGYFYLRGYINSGLTGSSSLSVGDLVLWSISAFGTGVARTSTSYGEVRGYKGITYTFSLISQASGHLIFVPLIGEV